MEPLEEQVRTVMAMTRQVPDSGLIQECLDKAIGEDNERRDGTGRALNTVMERVGSYAYECAAANVVGWRLRYGLPHAGIASAYKTISQCNSKEWLDEYTTADSIDSPELKQFAGKSLDPLVLTK